MSRKTKKEFERTALIQRLTSEGTSVVIQEGTDLSKLFVRNCDRQTHRGSANEHYMDTNER